MLNDKEGEISMRTDEMRSAESEEESPEVNEGEDTAAPVSGQEAYSLLQSVDMDEAPYLEPDILECEVKCDSRKHCCQ